MGRFSFRETVHYLLKFDLARATRRWRGHAIWRGIPIRYWSAREIRRPFGPHFRIERRISIGHGDHQLYILRRADFSLQRGLQSAQQKPPC